MKKSTIIITGAAGFIGSKLSNEIDYEKFNVYAIDDLYKGKKKNISKKAKFIRQDLSKKNFFQKLPKNCDYIIHLAGQSSGERSFYEPEADYKRNFLTTLNMLEYAKNKNVKNFVFASSMAVYGNLKKMKQKEDINCYPLSNYGRNKYLSEKVILMQNKCNFTIFRLFNTYGEGQDMKDMRQGMISIYLSNLIKNNKIIVKGSTNRVRDFIHIDDVIKILLKAIKSRSFLNKVINLGTGKKTKISYLIKILKKLKKNTKIILLKPTPCDQDKIYSDNTRLNQCLGYKYKFIKLEEGIRKFFNYEKQ